ncbi:MAG: DUF2314 domain-containing protein [Myxococcaceae bacterium]|nr:DUF2314 domain-containing protein [Myxococcaceae bacterium]
MSLLRMLTQRCVPVLLVLALAPLAKAGAEAPAPSAKAFPRAELYAPEVTWSVLLFHPTAPKSDLVARARKLLASKYKGLNSVAEAESSAATATRPEALVQPLPPEDLEPMDERMLEYFGRKLEASERKQLLGARHATLLAFRAPFAQRHEVLLSATRFAHQLAAEHGAFLWDTETREYFSARSWKETRLDGWSGGVPPVNAHITLHVYQDGSALRVISLGMAKLGLPDVVVEQVPASMDDGMGRLVNGVAQLLAEGLVPAADGTLEVDLAKVKDARLKRQLQPREGARGRVKLRALEGQRDQGDPENVLLELSFPGTGALEERQRAALDTLLGKPVDEVTSAPPEDPELEAVARKARARLAVLKPRVAKGLQYPERLLLKASFRTDGGNLEYMWLEVTSVDKNGRWHGRLANEPNDVSRLRLGSPVDVADSEVSDYLYESPEGSREGGESSQILLRRQER